MSITDPLKIIESPLRQASGAKAALIYSVDFSAQGGAPTSATVSIWDLSSGADVSATCLSGTASISGSAVITPSITGLTAGVNYRLECYVVIGGVPDTRYAIIEVPF